MSTLPEAAEVGGGGGGSIDTVSINSLGYFGGALLYHLGRSLENGSINAALTAYARNEDVIAAMAAGEPHPDRPDDGPPPQNVLYTSSIEQATAGQDLIIMAPLSSATRGVLRAMREYLQPGVILLNTAKALDEETGARLSQVYEEELKGVAYRYALLAGGTLAGDLRTEQPLGAVIAAKELSTAEEAASIIRSDSLIIDTTEDLYGVEMISAMKNVISVAAGLVGGLNLNYGTQTMMISKLSGHIARACIDHGANIETFLSGNMSSDNDLWMSATGGSRNREFGETIGRLGSVEDALAFMENAGKSVESVSTIASLHAHPEIFDIPIMQLLHGLVQTREVSVDDFKASFIAALRQ